jgi:hypothetical protein
MEGYEIYLELLFAGSAAILSLSLLSGLAAFCLWLCGLWLPLLLARARNPSGRRRRADADNLLRDSTSLLAVGLAAGLGSAVTAWTISLLLSDSFLPGNLILCGTCLASLAAAWKWRDRISWKLVQPAAFLFASLFAFTLGLWHHAATELPVLQDGSRLVFSDLHRDLGAHVGMAGLVRDGGLPMQSFWGAAEHEYWALSHTGHLVLIAGLSQCLGVSLYQASCMLWIAAGLGIAWTVLSFSSRNPLPACFRLLLVATTLVWGAFTWPEVHRLYEPMRGTSLGAFELDAPSYWVAGRGFWNLPQTLSITLTLAALLLLDAYGSVRRKGRTHFPLLIGACFLLIAGGWTKPSLAIFYAPALLLWLVWNRAPASEILAICLALGTGCLLYLAPALFFALPDSPAWSFQLDPQQWKEVAEFAFGAGFAPLLLVVAVLLGRQKRKEPWRSYQILDLALLAAGGSLLFGLLFREDQFVGSPTFQPNIWWGMAASLVLLLPILGGQAFLEWKQKGWPHWLAGLGLCLSLLHVFNGFCLAIVYPTLNLRGHSLEDAETLAMARSMTQSGTRFALDPALQDYDLLGYLSRPALLPSAVASQTDRRDLAIWHAFATGSSQVSKDFLQRFDAVILHGDRRSALRSLASLKWRREVLDQGFELWQPTGR